VTSAIDTLFLEERRYPPPEDFAAQANAKPEIYARDFEEFWATEGRERVTWLEPFEQLYTKRFDVELDVAVDRGNDVACELGGLGRLHASMEAENQPPFAPTA